MALQSKIYDLDRNISEDNLSDTDSDNESVQIDNNIMIPNPFFNIMFKF